MAQFNIGLGIGFSAITIPQLQQEDSQIKVELTDIAWFGKSISCTVTIQLMDLSGIQMVKLCLISFS